MLTFITGNESKAKELSRHLSIQVDHKKIDLEEIQSLSLKEIVIHKAISAYAHIGTPVLIEDTSLTFHALGNLPGPLIKWFLQELDTQGLSDLVSQYSDHTASAEVLYAYYDGKDFYTFGNVVKGSISVSPRGSNGFGWDSIFIPNGHRLTWAEMSDEERAPIALRLPAVQALEDFLRTL